MIYFFTSNHGKFAEVKRLLSGFQVTRGTIEYPELQADTQEAVVNFALSWLKKEVDGPFIIEDSGLYVDAVGGFPGVYSAYVFRTVGNPGILKLLQGAANREASFKSVVGLYDDRPHVFEGVCRGRIAPAERGTHGFGYDPIFSPQGNDTTFGEMLTEEKNTYSHRGKAVAQLLTYLDH